MPHRTSIVDRPPGKPAVRFQWLHLLFMHWPVPAAILRPLIPEALEIDTFPQRGGNAWIGLVPFTMRSIRHRLWPPIPTMYHFHECNVRTYVTFRGHPGVWFLSLDAVSLLAVWGARLLWHLPYFHSHMTLQREGDRIDYSVSRRSPHDEAPSMTCSWTAGEPLPPSQPGDQMHFLTERYSLFTADRRGRVLHGRIWHEPWSLRTATLLDLDDTLVGAAGIDLSGAPDPICWHSDHIDAEAWPLQDHFN